MKCLVVLFFLFFIPVSALSDSNVNTPESFKVGCFLRHTHCKLAYQLELLRGDSDYMGCIDEGKEEARLRHEEVVQQLQSQNDKDAFKEYYIAYVSALN